MVNSDRLNYLFEKYIINDCSDEEFNEFFCLLKEKSAKSSIENRMKNEWGVSTTKNKEFDIDWAEMERNIKRDKIDRRISIRYFYKYAAVLLIVLSSIWVWRAYLETKATDSSSVFADIYQEMKEISVPYNETLELKLPDGTLVSLNAGSHFYYPKEFIGDKREVYLEGEAYFEVKQMDNKPFMVHAKHSITKVLGTSFNIESYRQTGETKVTVLTGKVAVGLADQQTSVELLPNQFVSIEDNGGDWKKSMVKYPDDVVAWRKGGLVFDNVTWHDIAARLSLRYGVEISFTREKIARCHVSAVFKNASLKSILNVLTQLTGTSFREIDAQHIEIYGTGC